MAKHNIEIPAALIEEMARRRHGKRRWLTWPPDTQAVMRARIVESITEVFRAQQAVERRSLQEAR